MDNKNRNKDLGELLRQQRVAIPLTLQELAASSGVSPSHLGRVERGERFPSASTLRRIAPPLGIEEYELFTLAGYLSSQPPGIAEIDPRHAGARLDPYVAGLLAQEPVDLQRAVIAILTILKAIARSMKV